MQLGLLLLLFFFLIATVDFEIAMMTYRAVRNVIALYLDTATLIIANCFCFLCVCVCVFSLFLLLLLLLFLLLGGKVMKIMVKIEQSVMMNLKFSLKALLKDLRYATCFH